MSISICGMKTAVGEEPVLPSISSLGNFNGLFLFISKKKSIKMNRNFQSKFRCSYVSMLQCFRWLKHHQLITMEKEFDDAEEQGSKTYYLIDITKLGKEVAEEGALIKVGAYGEIGVGKIYSEGYDELWDMIYQLWKKEKISESKIWTWHSEYRTFWKGMLHLRKEQLEQKSRDWAWSKINTSKLNRRGRKFVNKKGFTTLETF